LGAANNLAMDFDITNLLEKWDYRPGQVVVRKFTGLDGVGKIQLRVDLGLLQMNARGRPDGRRPFGHESLLDYHLFRLQQHVAANPGRDDLFELLPEDCGKLQREAFQYHHRCLCLMELNDYDAVIVDAGRNLKLFNFVAMHTRSQEAAWTLQQFQPQVLMMLTRARAARKLEINDHSAALLLVEQGLEEILTFFRECSRPELYAVSPEVQSLEKWHAEIRANRPIPARERLEQALNEAVGREDYEKAASVRDALRNMQGGKTEGSC
jgi:hypothetical protein